MGIKHLKYNQIDFEKYDICIENSYNSCIYAFSWYLDIVAEKQWEVLVLGDYESVMPLPVRKKYFITYVHNPLWVLQLGVFSINENNNNNPFIKKAFSIYKLIDLRLNIDNKIGGFSEEKTEKQTHFLKLDNYDVIKSNFRSDRKKDLKRAVKSGLYGKWNDDLKLFLDLFFKNITSRVSSINEKDFNRLQSIIEICIEKEKGELLSVFDENNNLVASGFFLKHNKKITILVSTTDLKNRKNGANTYLIDQAIKKYLSNYKVFNFGGSSIKSIANYFLSFGAKENMYYQINYNNLPLLYKIIKSLKK